MTDDVPGITDPTSMTYCTRCDVEIEAPNKLCKHCERLYAEQRAIINEQQRQAARREREAARG